MQIKMTTVVLALAITAAISLTGYGHTRADEAALRRSDMDRIVRAMETQAQASKDLASAVRDAARQCGRSR